MADADVHTHTSSAPCAASGAVEARQATQRLLEAARDGSLEDFSLAEKSFPAEDLAAVKEGLGRNALHMAALGGQLDICNYLVLDRGFDIDQVDEQGNTPLKHALMQKQPGTVHKLLQLGADARVTVGNDPAPIHYAAASGTPQAAPSVWKPCSHGGGVNDASAAGTPLLWAASAGYLEGAKLLLEKGADVAGQDGDGVTALLLSAALGNVELTQLLLDAGAAVDARAQGAVTPLHVAAETGRTDVVSLLLQAGADPDAEDEAGARPIDAAASTQERAVVELLLPVTKPAPSGEWTASWLLDHAERAAQVPEHSHCGCRHSHGPGHEHAHAPDTDEVEVPAAVEPDEGAAATAKRRGDEAFVAADYPAAVAAYTRALRHDTSSHALWANRSAASLRTGDHEAALADARIARTVNPAFTKAWYREGCAARELGRWNDAAQAFFCGYRTDPTNQELAGAFQAAVERGKQAHAAAQAGGVP